ncbi:DUF2461 domain-containing protein [Actinomadura sp. 6K520]|uniref:DUF2461 domain-containing protein n=1 Tax=Actinomadura sp. 6K520 TaxID=2530364 RepID=UPI00104EC5A2|nr:DUF2461 domain-containing protein [Actinomadura sp. 6K520]TDE32230.1 DUF2461 domain-containing protein [Actinomadura sp. 6K520]
MKFKGFTDETFAFYEGLQADNSKSYWAAHKDTYERHVREPMAELCAELEDEFGAVKLFRPYRDLRFSKDKTPYKTHQGGHTSEGFYVQVDADGLLAAGGMYAPTPEQLRRYRDAAGSGTSGGELQAIVDELRAAGMEIAGDRLKTRPRGTPPDHPRLELLRHRSLYAHEGWPADPWMRTPEVVPRIREAWRRLRPLVDWGRRHLGAPGDTP